MRDAHRLPPTQRNKGGTHHPVPNTEKANKQEWGGSCHKQHRNKGEEEPPTHHPHSERKGQKDHHPPPTRRKKGEEGPPLTTNTEGDIKKEREG